MDKKLLKYGGKFVFSHFLMVVLSFAIYYVFGWLFDRIGMFRYSLVCTLIYGGCIYSEAWKWGKNDAKTYNDVKESPLRALIASAVPFAICLLFILCLLFNYKVMVVGIVAKVWYMPFVGFFNLTKIINCAELFFAGLVTPAFMVIGYYAGMKNFALIGNLSSDDKKKKGISALILGGITVLSVVLALCFSGHKMEIDRNHWAIRNHSLTESLEQIEKDETKNADTTEGVYSEENTKLSYGNAKIIGYDCPLEYKSENGKIKMTYTFSVPDTAVLAGELKTRLGEPSAETENKIEWSADGYLYTYNIDGNSATLEISAE